jgi:isoleucyl-tRNA synthetase
MKAVRKIQYFVLEDLSNWYIRRARRRFWAEELSEDKKSVYGATWEILTGVARLAAPLAPFIADELYTKLTGEDSVHLALYPQANGGLLDEGLEERMELVRNLVALGRGAREKERIKVRQPLNEILVDGKLESLVGGMTDLIKEELNVKNVVFEKDLSRFMNFVLKPNFKTAGPVLGSKIKDFAQALKEADAACLNAEFESAGAAELNLGGESMRIEKDLVDVQITAKEGFTAAMENNLFAILDTTVTGELISEGLAREFVSKVQQLRKQYDFEMMDQIHISFSGDDDVAAALADHRSYVMKETLALSLERADLASEGSDSASGETGSQEWDLNGHRTGINVVKAGS